MDTFKSIQNLCHLDWLVNVQILRYQANAGTVRTVVVVGTTEYGRRRSRGGNQLRDG